MAKHKDWFAVDTGKRAALVRSRTLPRVVKELLANSLDAGANNIVLQCEAAEDTRRNQAGLQAFRVTCTDDGHGCNDPEILRRIGASTSDLHAETRGRFGQGLIDLICISELAEIRTGRHRLKFDAGGCTISRTRDSFIGMQVEAIIRHDGTGYSALQSFFAGIILPESTSLVVGSAEVAKRTATRMISDVPLQTVVYSEESGQVRRFQRKTKIEILQKHDDEPMIYELGIPVDTMPWQLPFDVNVLQKTPLDTERDMLPDRYKERLRAKLIAPMSSDYIDFMEEHDEVPTEIRDDRENASSLNEAAQRLMVRTVTGSDPADIVRRNPLDADDLSESQELEVEGFAPVNRGSLPAGVSELLKDATTVAEKHDDVCKPKFRKDENFPKETERQRVCMASYAEIASALVGKKVRVERVGGGSVAATYGGGKLRLNINVAHIWDNPLGENSLGLIIHECAHDRVSGHAVEFREEVERLGGKLAGWVGDNPDRWGLLKEKLEAELLTVTGETQ